MEWYLLRLELWRKVTQSKGEHGGFYIAAIVRHRGTVGAWRNRGYLRVLLIFLSTSLQNSGLQDFLKCLLPKLSATRRLRLCRSLCLRHLRDIVCFPLRVLPLSVWHLYVVDLLYHSIFRKRQKIVRKCRQYSTKSNNRGANNLRYMHLHPLLTF